MVPFTRNALVLAVALLSLALATAARADDVEPAAIVQFGEDAERGALASHDYLPEALRLGPVSLGSRTFLRIGSGDAGPRELLLEGSLAVALGKRWSVGVAWSFGPEPEQGGHVGALLLRRRF